MDANEQKALISRIVAAARVSHHDAIQYRKEFGPTAGSAFSEGCSFGKMSVAYMIKGTVRRRNRPDLNK